jgi:hypothetical protein
MPDSRNSLRHLHHFGSHFPLNLRDTCYQDAQKVPWDLGRQTAFHRVKKFRNKIGNFVKILELNLARNKISTYSQT